MQSPVVGLLCLLFFALSQGVRDALFGNVFQSVSFFVVAALAFGMSTLIFTGIAAASNPAEFRKLSLHPLRFIFLNVATAIAWLGFFYGLTYLEPAVAATLYNGIGPITVLALAVFGGARTCRLPSAPEFLCYLGIASALVGLAFVTLTNRSGLQQADTTVQAIALIATVLGGVMITVSHLLARQFNDEGVGSIAVMGTRFFATLVVAIVIVVFGKSSGPHPSWSALPILAVVAFALIAFPSFMLQLGIARASPLAVNVVRALGPVSVFAIQQFDGRLQFSGATMFCISAFCFFAVAASALRGWGETRPVRIT